MQHLTPELGPDDGRDPKRSHDRRTAKPGDRKARQLCEQVRDALTVALAGLADPVLQNLTVVAVAAAPHTGRLRVTVTGDPAAAARLAAAAGRLRTDVAASIHRRKAPELVFAVG